MNVTENKSLNEIEMKCNTEAKVFNVSELVHSEDFIFQFCISHECFHSVDDAVGFYFRQGLESAKKLSLLMDKYCKLDSGPLKLLEFASGFGAVTRHFKNILPDVDVTACDIHKKAVDFTKEKLFVNAELSNTTPESLVLSEKYDAIFALSFFTHIPKKTWSRWLLSLINNLKDNGVLIFTTHGEVSRGSVNNPVIDEDGFWFKPESEQHDLDGEDYGMTVTLEKYVKAEVEKIEGVELCFYEEGYWWGHQDAYVLRKIKI